MPIKYSITQYAIEDGLETIVRRFPVYITKDEAKHQTWPKSWADGFDEIEDKQKAIEEICREIKDSLNSTCSSIYVSIRNTKPEVYTGYVKKKLLSAKEREELENKVQEALLKGFSEFENAFGG